jgi:hypothetical protein
MKCCKYDPRSGATLGAMPYRWVRRRNTRHNDIQHNDTQHNDNQLNNKYNASLSLMTFSVIAVLLCPVSLC